MDGSKCKPWFVRLVGLFAVTMSLILPLSCRKERKTPSAEGTPIAFNSFDSRLTRAIPDTRPLEESWDSFQVHAFKWHAGDVDGETVFPGYKVMYDGSDWNYEGVTENQYHKFWDLSADRYLFTAVAPAPNPDPSAGEGYRNTTVTMGEDGHIRIDKVRGNLSTGDYDGSSHSPDWMVAQTERRTSPLVDLDVLEPSNYLHENGIAPASLTSKVPLCFHHLMARTDILVWSTTPIIIQQFKVDAADGKPIISSANWSTESGWTDKDAPESHKPLMFADYTYPDGKTVSTRLETPSLMLSHVQIPQEWTDSRQLMLTFTTTDGTVYQGTITLNETTNQSNSWIQNRHYRYIIKIDTKAGDTQVILFAVDMETWKWKEGSSIEDPQTGW